MNVVLDVVGGVPRHRQWHYAVDAAYELMRWPNVQACIPDDARDLYPHIGHHPWYTLAEALCQAGILRRSPNSAASPHYGTHLAPGVTYEHAQAAAHALALVVKPWPVNA